MTLGVGPLDRFCPNGVILAGSADLRCKARWGAIVALPSLTRQRAGAAAATPAQPRNALRHARWGSATTLPPVAFTRASIASRSMYSPIRWVAG